MLNPVTDEKTWLEFLRDTPAWQPEQKTTVVLAPHPDDETLGAGGLIAFQNSRNVSVCLLAATDGEAAYPNTPGLAELRRAEQLAAAQALGLDSHAVFRFFLRDSGVAPSEELLTDLIKKYLTSNSVLVAPWQFDPHPDHEACARAAVRAAGETGATLVSYFFWTWHRSGPESLRGLPLRRLNLSAECQAARANALSCHRSQLEREDGPPVLPEIFLAPARRTFETFIVND